MDARPLGFPDRRHPRPSPQSPLRCLEDMPPLVLLGRLPTALLAVDDHGKIVYANDAFAGLVGRARCVVMTMALDELTKSVPLGSDGAMSVLRAHAGSVVELLHADGWAVPVLMSDSALFRHDDPLAVVTFADLSEYLWHTGRAPREWSAGPDIRLAWSATGTGDGPDESQDSTGV